MGFSVQDEVYVKPLRDMGVITAITPPDDHFVVYDRKLGSGTHPAIDLAKIRNGGTSNFTHRYIDKGFLWIVTASSDMRYRRLTIKACLIRKGGAIDSAETIVHFTVKK